MKNFRTQAGVYECGDMLVALNRPAAEDLPETIEAEAVITLLEAATVRIVEDLEEVGEDSLHSEIWRVLICLALLFMIVEAGLLLSARRTVGRRSITEAGQRGISRTEPAS
jgi:hypothetical protein